MKQKTQDCKLGSKKPMKSKGHVYIFKTRLVEKKGINKGHELMIWKYLLL